MSTAIQWTDETWNPIRGCSRVSPGCENCYAERHAARFCGPGLPFEGFAIRKLKVISDDDQRLVPRWTGKVDLQRAMLDQPLRWRKPRRVFVNSMSDLFHEALSDDERELRACEGEHDPSVTPSPSRVCADFVPTL